ncbi:tRNA pseudouridine synthase B [Mesomycoplasma conjunctivae]|uniref:tRNA pseudouridine(55) synthase n=1 Tax=Mesomycoplasma conjunctivae (strain ATCC 25834 / NCTC 10147 / HRC/581) TaxID=572263 RepID=C5J6V5_MESCH|nr:tRNA pseudouridine(55) synthase TruB [Mesomycoplasma conjunctivae]CAT05218.1 tRNA pseudouridine synthase B [Mesomycoplasma conjunctivae]VEU66433.1 tRNA pseudouridine synthase B [Mesomycoplasma conjunctivae]
MIKLLYKPSGISSFKFITRFAKDNKIQKIGHTGTLDPLARGLMLIATDDDTKLIEYIDKGEKEYIADFYFGKISTTYDIEGQISNYLGAKKVDKEALLLALANLAVIQVQKPPIFSAKKLNGVRAYSLAQQQKNIELKDIPIKIFDWELLDFDYQNQSGKVRWVVSRGTYIRSLIHDLGFMLKSGAIMSGLERTKIAHLDKTFLDLEINPINLINKEIVKINFSELKKIFQGYKIPFFTSSGEKIIIYDGKIIGIGAIANNVLFSSKLFGNKIKKIIYDVEHNEKN